MSKYDELLKEPAFVKFYDWAKKERDICKDNGDEMFLGWPDAWYEAGHMGCQNGHVSSRSLKSEAIGGNVCLACFKPLTLLPPSIWKDSELKKIIEEKV